MLVKGATGDFIPFVIIMKKIVQLKFTMFNHVYIDGLAQDCSNSIANALELLQSWTKPSTCSLIRM